MKTISIKAALLAAGVAAGVLSGMALPAVAQAQGYAWVRVGPPPPRHELAPPLRHGWVWVPGHYQWRHGRHVWVGGYWVRERHGYVHVAPVWVQDGGRWYYRPARWDAHPRHGPPPRRFVSQPQRYHYGHR